MVVNAALFPEAGLWTPPNSLQQQRQNTGKLQIYHDLSKVKKPDDLESRDLKQTASNTLVCTTEKEVYNFSPGLLKAWSVIGQ